MTQVSIYTNFLDMITSLYLKEQSNARVKNWLHFTEDHLTRYATIFISRAVCNIDLGLAKTETVILAKNAIIHT